MEHCVVLPGAGARRGHTVPGCGEVRVTARVPRTGCGDGPQRLRGVLPVLTVNVDVRRGGVDEGGGGVDLGRRDQVRLGHEHRLRGGELARDRVPHELVPQQTADGGGVRAHQHRPGGETGEAPPRGQLTRIAHAADLADHVVEVGPPG